VREKLSAIIAKTVTSVEIIYLVCIAPAFCFSGMATKENIVRKMLVGALWLHTFIFSSISDCIKVYIWI